ncbi:hypothetical protein [Rhizobium leguminosarum]|uniref:Uncharacterized protein n=1 Tax=Rhizobium leguminosarum TaxID=384 RepID=A0A1B1CJX8_RHILE|nr:hypothetical protein [Rhizobium leguminosarum]ANP90075.1 hypothetical protein BA011_39755 [Rhizobium leguminosarum]
MTDLQRWADHAIRQARVTLVAGKMNAMTAAVEVAAELGAAGPDADELKRRMDEPTGLPLPQEATAKAASGGVFVEDEMYFGNDRLHLVQII